MTINYENINQAISALNQCVKENENKQTDTGNIRVSNLCADVAYFLCKVRQDYKKWRKTNYPKFEFNDILVLQCCMETSKEVQEDKELYGQLQSLHDRLYDAYRLDNPQGEQKETLCDKCKKTQPSHSCQDITALGRCALEKQGEQKSSWSEEDESNLNSAIYFIRREPYHEHDAEPIVDWLRALKERVQPQPKQEWSVEDRSKVQRICKYLNEAKKYCADITEVRECIEWIKALIPQNT